MPAWVDPIPALKRRVADEILRLLDGWTQEYAASFLHATQSQVSDLRRGRLERFSLDRLVRSLSRLNRSVEIVTTKAPGFSVHPHREIDAAAKKAASEAGTPASTRSGCAREEQYRTSG